MAKIENNILLYGVSGMIGDQIVVRQTEHGAVMAVRPRKSADREPTELQQAQQEKFRIAVMYGKGARGNEVYKELAASRSGSAFNVATADFLHPPEIVEVDVSGYSGRQGDVLTVRAFDDVRVKEVGVIITGKDNAIVERGSFKQVEGDATLWQYVATANAETDHVQVIVDAADLAGQVTEETVERDL